VTNQNLIQEEITRILNSGNACYHSIQNLLSSRPLIGDWGKLHNEELHNLYSSPSIIRMISQLKKDEVGRACSTNRVKRNAYRILVGKLKGDH
jgi:hypothetical protein